MISILAIAMSVILNMGFINTGANAMTPFSSDTLAVATLGGGCFWCIEAVFEQVEGVTEVVNGYAGGHAPNPTYEAVCSGTTGHAEVCQIHYDPKIISYKEILEIFFSVHDPTTLNRQGADVGEQYRSIILYHSPQQKAIAEQFIKELQQSGRFTKPIVTQIQPLKVFYRAEAYHQNYFQKHPEQAYCRLVIQPKVDKLKKQFKEKVKP